MNWNLAIGKNWGQRGIIVGAAILYIYMIIFSPGEAWQGITSGLRMFASLLTLIFAAILLASAIQIIIPDKFIQEYLGSEAGLKGVLTGGLLAGILQGGPYAVYPIIKGLQEEGVGTAVVLAMLVGYSMIGSGRIVYGLAFFEIEIIATRVFLSIGLTVLGCTLLYTVFGE